MTEDQWPWPSEATVTAARDGDAQAIEALVEGSHDHVRRFARTLCATPQDAEDATQEALIVLFSKIGTLRASAALASWMYRIVKNECMRRTRLLLHVPIGEQTEVSAEEEVIRRMGVDRVARAIAVLPGDQRSVLIARDLQGESGSATAAQLGLSRSAMKSRLHRAREAVRHSLAEGQAD